MLSFDPWAVLAEIRGDSAGDEVADVAANAAKAAKADDRNGLSTLGTDPNRSLGRTLAHPSITAQVSGASNSRACPS